MILATAALLAAPILSGAALAQTAPQTPPAAPPAASQPGAEAYGGKRMMRMHRGPMWQNVSPEGRAILRETLQGDPKDREATRAARDRINTIVGAERLDVSALRRAMEDERRLVDSQHAKRQASMLAAIQKLSAADRKAFAEDARRARADVEARTANWRKRAEDGRGMRDMPPPAPVPAPGTAI
jgi:Spy/CpxP family protein refolding chaperone